MAGKFALAGVAALFLVTAPALGQQTPPQRIRGTIEKLTGDQLTVKASDGMDMAVALTPKTRIGTLVKRSLADSKPGDFLLQPGSRARTARFTRSKSASCRSRRPMATGNSRGISNRTA
jgi:hypothetical protein